MKIANMERGRLSTERLILIPFTTQICQNILSNDFNFLSAMELKKGISWPDDDVMESLPRILDNLSKVQSPTGFGSWMIIKKTTLEVIGDIGFKGLNSEDESVDIGYGIIVEERRRGYAEEAANALIQWAFTDKRVKKITASCLHENQSSVHLLKKLRFTESFKDDQMLFWSLQKEKKTSELMGEAT